MLLDFSVITDNLDFFLRGFLFTVKLASIAIVGGFIFGLILALARYSKIAVIRLIAGVYVDLMRSVPLLLALFWIFFLAPMFLQWTTGSPRPVKVGAENTAIAAFILFEAAYYCEIIRSGIRSVSSGQWNASLALGMKKSQMMVAVILPQAIKNMIPVFLTQAVILFQDTSLVYVLSVTDFLGAASIIGIRDGSLVEPYIFVALIYLVVSVLLTSVAYYFSKSTSLKGSNLENQI